MPSIRRLALPFALVLVVCAATSPASAEKPSAKPKRILLIGQGPDGHPWNSHEYMAGQRILASCLQPVKGVQVIVVNAKGAWKAGPELLDGADGVVLFVSQGGRWLQQDKRRLAAFQRLAKRGGGMVAIHWGMGSRDAKDIRGFVALFGGIHGGPDRKYKVLTTTTEIAAPKHPILKGVKPVTLKEEFYYRLKLAKYGKLTPLLKAEIDGEKHTVAFAWERPEGGRSFGFTGCHFHQNWQHDAYRRMITQAVLWTVNVEPPAKLPLGFKMRDLAKPRPKSAKK